MIRMCWLLLSHIEQVKKSINIPVNVIIRPRGGDFYYNDDEVRNKIVFFIRWKSCSRISVPVSVLVFSIF